jgi:uncharacterized radical SAM superfamily Fe-S cluster-containing enzyme
MPNMVRISSICGYPTEHLLDECVNVIALRLALRCWRLRFHIHHVNENVEKTREISIAMINFEVYKSLQGSRLAAGPRYCLYDAGRINQCYILGMETWAFYLVRSCIFLRLTTSRVNMLLFITDRCNSKCSHCMSCCSDDGKDMSDDVLTQAIEFINCVNPLVINVSGGEPTLHSDLLESSFLA